MNLSVMIAVYPGVTHLDFTGPHQFLCRIPGAQVTLASMGGQPVAADGLVFSGLSRLEEQDSCDVLFVPGGQGCTDTFETPGFLDAIRRLALGARYITSVCTGSLILGAAGLLQGKRAACHWAWRDLLVPFGAIPDSARVVRDANVITGGGVTAGMDFALTLIEELAGAGLAQTIQLGLEYAPEPPYHSGRPETAPAEIVQRYSQGLSALRVVRTEAVNKAVGRFSA